MGNKVVFFILILVFAFGCECPKNNTFIELSNSQKEWFSQVPINDSLIQVNGSNGETDLLKYSVYYDGKSARMMNSSSNDCPEYESFEIFTFQYFSRLQGFYFTFTISSENSPSEFSGTIRNYTPKYVGCTFKPKLINRRFGKPNDLI